MTQPDGGPRTRAGIAADLRRLGVVPGETLLVHASLHRLGFVAGGALAVVQALLDAVGPGGTLVVPAFTADNSDPSRWALTRKEAVPPSWWPALREHLPAFDPARTPAHGVGAIAETVRTWPGALRSDHPQTSFAALGPAAAALVEGHDRDCHLGPASPLGRLHDRGARTLLLGVPYGTCTAFHLAEYQQAAPPRRDYECVVLLDGHRHWYRYEDVALSDADFDRIGADLEASAAGRHVRRGTVGGADARLLPVTEAVAFARTWMAAHRGQPPGLT